MRHAYLIIAHHEFEILNMLIKALDDSRNDIYIHFDKKIDLLPQIKTANANLFILQNRLDVRWGHTSQIDVEILLFESAYNNRNSQYSYFHLLSGVDLPIKSQDYIHNFFLLHQGKQFIGFTQGNTQKEIDRKVRRYHLFSEDFRESRRMIQYVKKFIRAFALRVQELMGVKRNKRIEFKKGTNWVSVTHDFVQYLLNKKDEIRDLYKMSFCADEIFLQTVCWNSLFKGHVYDLSDSRNSSKRMINWKNNQVHSWLLEDVDFLISSPGLFARKFSSQDRNVAQQIINKINRRSV